MRNSHHLHQSQSQSQSQSPFSLTLADCSVPTDCQNDIVIFSLHTLLPCLPLHPGHPHFPG